VPLFKISFKNNDLNLLYIIFIHHKKNIVQTI
jgi:hypothetical protein